MPLPAQTITLTGADAIAFAQAQFSADACQLEPGRWQWSAWLSAKGRVRALMQVARIADDELLLLLRGGDATALAHELRRFVFRSKVAITPLPVRTIVDAQAMDDGMVIVDGDLTTFGFGTYAFAVGNTVASQAWRAHAIGAGHPWLDDGHLGQLLPPSLSLERLHGVSFTKGCFPGQEIVARLHHLGGNKQHLYSVRVDAPLTDALALTNDGKHVGVVLNGVQSDAGWIALTVLHEEFRQCVGKGSIALNDGTVILTLEQAWGA